MNDEDVQREWVDRYLLDRMTEDEVVAFETALLESSELQSELEAALATRAALRRVSETEINEPAANDIAEIGRPGVRLQSIALAATLVLAVVSNVMWWNTADRSSEPGNGAFAPGHADTNVLTVAVPIMRSASGQTPDVIVQKPEGPAAIVFDIELGMTARAQPQLEFKFVDLEGTPFLSWHQAPDRNGRATVAIQNFQIPAARFWLEVLGAEGERLERRLLEFRPPPAAPSQ
jgi:hypothetical protein